MRPGDSGSMLTSKPGLGVAQRTSTREAENEIAAVPPVKAKVRVVAVGAVGPVVVEVGTVDGDVDVAWVDDGEVCVGRAFGTVVDGAAAWLADVVLDSSGFDAAVSDRAVLDGIVLDGIAEEPVVGAVVVVAEAKSAAGGGATIWLSTTETPAHATPTAATLATSQIENRISFLMGRVSPAR